MKVVIVYLPYCDIYPSETASQTRRNVHSQAKKWAKPKMAQYLVAFNDPNHFNHESLVRKLP